MKKVHIPALWQALPGSPVARISWHAPRRWPVFFRCAGVDKPPPPGPPVARISRLPTSRVLTLNMDEPEPWLVEAVKVKQCWGL